MSEIIKDFIKFTAEIILLLIIFSVILDPEGGIAANTFNILTYAEPILLQNHIATALTTAGNIPGEFSTSFKTSGLPYVIEIYEENSIDYINLNLTLINRYLLNTKFAKIDPIPITTDCFVPEQTIILERELVQTLSVEKTIDPSVKGGCTIGVSV